MTPALPQREAYSIRETRELLGGISQATAYALIRRGELVTFRIGRRRLVGAEAIRTFIANRESAARQAA